MRKIHPASLLLCASIFCGGLSGEILDRKTVVIAPKKIERGKKTRIAALPATVEIYFPEGSARLRADARRQLQALPIAPGTRVQIMGHANSSGDRNYNRSLSRQRALAVLKYLKRKHPYATYRYRSFGEMRPAYSNRSRLGYRLNRRVVVRVIPQ
jgi:outer membrane protein OmpA-like peptidoglycan-associated protein